MTKRTDTFCIMPFIHLHNMSNGLFKMCCLVEIPIVTDFGKSYFVGNQPIDEVWNSNFLKSARKLMLEGKEVPICQNCYNIEDSGGKSLRLEYNEQYTSKNSHIVDHAKDNNYEVKEFPKFIELRTGNSCNSACRMCNSNDSSLVYIENSEILKGLKSNPFESSISDHTQTIIPDPNIVIFGRSEERTNNVSYNIDAHFDEIIKNIDQIETLTLSGGEPFLLEKTTDLLEILAEKNPNVKLHINTNGSIASERIQQALSKLNNVNLSISIDGFGSVNEYIRYPLKWSKIQTNLSKFYQLRKHGFYISVNITVQSFNIFNLEELIDFLILNYPDVFIVMSPLSMPFYLNIQTLPTDLKHLIFDKNNNIIDKLKQLPSTDCISNLIRSFYSLNAYMKQFTTDILYFDMFKSNIKVYDRHRNQIITDFIPSWKPYL